MITDRCQRWNRGREAYRPAGEPINPAAYGVEPLAQAQARPFVEMHHYSGSYPAARLAVGLWRSMPNRRAELAGVAVFSVPMTQKAIPFWTGVEPANGVELGRLVLLDDVAGNGETWFLARAREVLAAELPEVRAVLSYADPHRFVHPNGLVVTPGHIGTIYQALSARHVGRGSPRSRWIGPDGRVVASRVLTKIRKGERGAASAYARLVALGAPPKASTETWAQWVPRALHGGPFVQDRHPGCLAYVWPVGAPAQARATRRGFPKALAYPKAEALSGRRLAA